VRQIPGENRNPNLVLLGGIKCEWAVTLRPTGATARKYHSRQRLALPVSARQNGEMPEPSIAEILDFALSLNEEVSRFILPLWKNVAVDHKSDGSEVTEADRGAEQILRRRIGERFPEHAILGEEFGGERNHNAEHQWLLDPVDGTASFAIGLPVFGSLIAYLRRGQACVGVIGAHALGEIVYAAAGQGCWLRRDGSAPQRLHTSAVTIIGKAHVVATGFENTDLDPRFPRPDIRLSRLYTQARRFRWSGDCINYSLLCQGRIDVALDPRMNPWDIAALAPCVSEAGGALSSLDGNEDCIWQPNLVASANQVLHAQVLQALGPA
jgi:histidinol phosphatase-like enzyme (inositol monophosphatase family)